MSWDAVSGYTGQISFGHGFFFAAGGYTSALLNLEFGLDPLLTIPIGVLVAALGGVVLGVPALRLRGPYLSLVTLVAPLVLLNVFIIFSGTFGGELGFPSPDTLFGFGLGDAVSVYYLSLALLLAILVFLLAVTRSDTGAVFTAIREDPDAVAAAGLDPSKFKIFAFVLSGAVGGLAGAAFVHTPVGNPQPSQLFMTQVNIEVIIAAILGGMGTIVGAAIGGMIVYLLPEYLSGIDYVVPVLGTPIAEIDFLLFSVIALLLLFVLPGGVLRWVLARGRDLLGRARPGNDAVAADGGTGIEAGATPIAAIRERWTEVLVGRTQALIGRDPDPHSNPRVMAVPSEPTAIGTAATSEGTSTTKEAMNGRETTDELRDGCWERRLRSRGEREESRRPLDRRGVSYRRSRRRPRRRGSHETLRRAHRCRRSILFGRRRRDHGFHRAERRGQVDDV